MSSSSSLTAPIPTRHRPLRPLWPGRDKRLRPAAVWRLTDATHGWHQGCRDPWADRRRAEAVATLAERGSRSRRHRDDAGRTREGQAFRARWPKEIHRRWLNSPRQDHASARSSGATGGSPAGHQVHAAMLYRKLLDLETLVCTRRPNSALSRWSRSSCVRLVEVAA